MWTSEWSSTIVKFKHSFRTQLGLLVDIIWWVLPSVACLGFSWNALYFTVISQAVTMRRQVNLHKEPNPIVQGVKGCFLHFKSAISFKKRLNSHWRCTCTIRTNPEAQSAAHLGMKLSSDCLIEEVFIFQEKRGVSTAHATELVLRF